MTDLLEHMILPSAIKTQSLRSEGQASTVLKQLRFIFQKRSSGQCVSKRGYYQYISHCSMLAEIHVISALLTESLVYLHRKSPWGLFPALTSGNCWLVSERHVLRLLMIQRGVKGKNKLSPKYIGHQTDWICKKMLLRGPVNFIHTKLSYLGIYWPFWSRGSQSRWVYQRCHGAFIKPYRLWENVAHTWNFRSPSTLGWVQNFCRHKKRFTGNITNTLAKERDSD